MLAFDDWREAVAEWRPLRRERSLRWVADKTGFALGHVSEMLSLTRRRAANPVFIGLLGVLMELPPVGQRYFEALVRMDTAEGEKRKRRKARDFVGAERYEAEERAAWKEIRLITTMADGRDETPAIEGLIDRWVAGVVYEAMECGAPADPTALAARFLPVVSPEEVHEALAWLVESGLLREADGRYTRVAEGMLWFDATDSADERRRRMLAAHHQALRHYFWGIDTKNVPRDDRNYKLMFQAMPREMLGEVATKMDELLAWIHERALERGPCDTVYVLGLQAVPVTTSFALTTP
ncbi:MAG: DUF4423 domain-containing protein [Pseudomonadota bacterium]|nr:DUF4423 domain-containing protein [Pseudomonadota bacterium]